MRKRDGRDHEFRHANRQTGRDIQRQIDRLADKYRQDMGLPVVQLTGVLGKGATGVVYKGGWRGWWWWCGAVPAVHDDGGGSAG